MARNPTEFNYQRFLRIFGLSKNKSKEIAQLKQQLKNGGNDLDEDFVNYFFTSFKEHIDLELYQLFLNAIKQNISLCPSNIDLTFKNNETILDIIIEQAEKKEEWKSLLDKIINTNTDKNHKELQIIFKPLVNTSKAKQELGKMLTVAISEYNRVMTQTNPPADHVEEALKDKAKAHYLIEIGADIAQETKEQINNLNRIGQDSQLLEHIEHRESWLAIISQQEQSSAPLPIVKPLVHNSKADNSLAISQQEQSSAPPSSSDIHSSQNSKSSANVSSVGKKPKFRGNLLALSLPLITASTFAAIGATLFLGLGIPAVLGGVVLSTLALAAIGLAIGGVIGAVLYLGKDKIGFKIASYRATKQPQSLVGGGENRRPIINSRHDPSTRRALGARAAASGAMPHQNPKPYRGSQPI